MQQPAEISPSPNFAGLLASLAAPAPAHEPSSAWPAERTDDGLEDDFATLSYERALRAHARYRPTSLADQSFTQAADSDPLCLSADLEEAVPKKARPAPAQPETTSAPSRLSENNLKCSSVTIRLSQAECAQLRKRAAEAGLTISAYLRSCTFEAESLRAMVKDTLARLRSGAPAEESAGRLPSRRSWFSWLARLLPVAHGGRRAARA